MYILLTLFFISLIGITAMIGRKLMILQNIKVLNRENFSLNTEYVEKIKYSTIVNIKKYGYKGLVATIRFYVQSTNFLKNKYQEVKIIIKNTRNRRQENNPSQEKDVNKFLKVISEYKHKIREIKHRIKEEEESL